MTTLFLATWLSTYFFTYYGPQPIPSPTPAEMIVVPLEGPPARLQIARDPVRRA